MTGHGGVATWSHHLMDAARTKRILWLDEEGKPAVSRHPDILKIQHEMAEAFNEAAVFVMQQDGPDLMNQVLVDHARNTWLGLPYSEMLLEFPMSHYQGSDGDERWIVWASETEGHVQLSLFMAGTNTDLWAIEHGFVQFRIGGPGNVLHWYIEKADSPGYRDLCSSRLEAAVFALLSLIGLMNTPAVEKVVTKWKTNSKSTTRNFTAAQSKYSKPPRSKTARR